MIAIFGLLGLLSVTVSAASYQRVSYEKTKIGSYYFWLKSGKLYFGKTKSSSKAKKLYGCDSAVTNGKIIYYAERGNGGIQVEKYTIKEKRNEDVTFLSEMDEICGIYGRTIYVNGLQNDTFPINLYSYNMDTWHLKKAASNARGRACYGRYIVCTPQVGAIVDVHLYVYDAKRRKCKTIEKSIWNHEVKGKYVYYIKHIGGGYENLKIKAYRYCLTTGKKKALTKTVKAKQIYGLTSKSMTYYDLKGKKRKIKF